ncbi:phage minor capsid protein [Streptococcus orisratti]|uniref:phage minor capsid protein n=1 Tax=Streptococcus orisratti TaxID=114652 RepID=UPI003D08EE28
MVGSLASARPDCAYCQGQVLDVRPPEQADSGYPSVYIFGYGSPGGHRGVNCRHPWFPFVPGVSVNNQPQYDPEDAIENGRIEAGRQQLAGRIRNTKKKLMIAEELGAANTGKYKRQLLEQQAQMREYVQRHNLRRNYRLEKVYTPRQNVVDGGYKAILTKADKVRAAAQYEKYKSILSDKAPKTLDDYINIKYNGGEQYEQLQDRARWIKAKFPSEKSFNGHFEKHGHEFPSLTKEEYQKLASELIASPIDENILGYETEGGRRVRYDKAANIIVIGQRNKNNQVRLNTMLKPDDGEEYYRDNYLRDFPD